MRFKFCGGVCLAGALALLLVPGESWSQKGKKGNKGGNFPGGGFQPGGFQPGGMQPGGGFDIFSMMSKGAPTISVSDLEANPRAGPILAWAKQQGLTQITREQFTTFGEESRNRMMGMGMKGQKGGKGGFGT